MSRTSASKAMATIAGISALALFVSACSSSSTPSAGSSSTPSSSSSAAASVAPSSAAGASAAGGVSSSASASGGVASSAASSGGSSAGAAALSDDATYCDTLKKDWPNITGKEVSIYTSISGDEGKQLDSSFKDFTTCTGATIKYTSDKNFEQQIVVQAKSGNAPGIAFVPQPGLLATLVATGKVVEPPAQVTANVDKYFTPEWKGYGTVNGKFYAAPLGANVKSLVWYSPKMFAAKGYTVPTTWTDMIALSDKIAADPDGVKPWCAGVESGAATGWTATDWLEEVVMRQSGLDVYNNWVKHTVKFSDDPIKKALATVGSIWKNPKYVNAGIGDVNSIATTAFADGGLPIQQGKCYMHQQASFYETNFKGTPTVSPTGDIYAFYLPPMVDAFGKPIEVAGEFVTAFSQNPEVQAFQYFLTTAHWANAQSKSSISRVSANKGLLLSSVKDPIQKLSVQLLQDPSTKAGFDASDSMPAAVGSGAEWKQLTNWITGQDDDTTLAQIDQAWPSS